MLFSAPTGLLVDSFASELTTSDLAHAAEAHLHLDEGDILIGDDLPASKARSLAPTAQPARPKQQVYRTELPKRAKARHGRGG